MYKRAYLVDIFLVLIKIVFYLILDWPNCLGVYYKCLCSYSRFSADTFLGLLVVYATLACAWYLYYEQKN